MAFVGFIKVMLLYATQVNYKPDYSVLWFKINIYTLYILEFTKTLIAISFCIYDGFMLQYNVMLLQC